LRVIEWIIFGAASIANVVFSWPWLGNPHCHGFYRFFAFECIVGLILLQVPTWFLEVLSVRQLISWILLTGSFVLAVHGFWLLRSVGRPIGNIEQTTTLIRSGAYRYIRHPLYFSLILGSIGVLLKSLTLSALVLCCGAMLCIVITAAIEERENLARFGESYAEYIAETRMFVPLLF
jgi:protein-S-isoprenylcysteine O-methyltransferase Ste14